MKAESLDARVDRLGVGPSIGTPAIVFGLLAVVPCWLWRDHLRIPLPPALLSAAGGSSLGVGVGLYVWSLRLLRRAWRTGTLATTGPFAYTRHPVYAIWILLIFPGGGLLSGAWPLLLPALLGYLGFRRHVAKEEVGLKKSFGLQYEVYAREVPCLFPILWARPHQHKSRN